MKKVKTIFEIFEEKKGDKKELFKSSWTNKKKNKKDSRSNESYSFQSKWSILHFFSLLNNKKKKKDP